MAIKVETEIFNVLVQIMKSKLFTMSEMRNTETVIWYLRTIKSIKTADWISNNNIKYLTGLLEGFVIDNSQEEQQLKELTRKNL